MSIRYFDKIRNNPWHIFLTLSGHGFLKWMSDELYLRLMYRGTFGEKLDLQNPVKFNEKLQWLKLYNRKSEYTCMVDKYEVKEYVSGRIGEEYIIPTLGVWDKFEDIDFDTLPDEFVLKCTHDSASLIIVRDKSKLDIDLAKHKIEKCLKNDFFKYGREWPYKNVKPRIIAERYMTDDGKELKDYKFFCFNGEVKCFKIDYNRYTNHKANYYDLKMNLLPFGEVICPPDNTRKFDKPQNFERMVYLAEVLSKDFPFLRVDFYNIQGEIYFGELTFYPASGFGKFEPKEWDEILGTWVRLPKN